VHAITQVIVTELKDRVSLYFVPLQIHPLHSPWQYATPAVAKALKGARFALWKTPENLTDRQEAKLASVAKLTQPLYRAYLLKEELRQVFRLKGEEGKQLLKEWLQWARRCRIRPFVHSAKSISGRRADIEAPLALGLSNALVESTNTKIRLLMRQAFGFRDPAALIGLALVSLGGLCPPLPGRP